MSRTALADPAAEPATAAQVRELSDRWFFDPSFVRGWSKTRADTVIRNCLRREQRDKNHAAARASAQAEPGAAYEPTAREIVGRIDAADCLEGALGDADPDALEFCLPHAVYALSSGELRDLARLLVGQLRHHPVTCNLLGRGATE